MRFRLWLGSLVASLAMLAIPLAAQGAGGHKYLVMVVSGRDEDRATAENVAELLIARVAQNQIESVGPESLASDYPDQASLRRCAVDMGCISRAAATVGADHVLLGIMSREGQRVALSLELIDAVQRSSLARGRTILDMHDLASGTMALAGEVLGGGSGGEGRLTVTVLGGQAEAILLDGDEVGSGDTWESGDIPPGEHEVRVRLPGGHEVVELVQVEPGPNRLEIRVGEAAAPWERHLHRADEALRGGDPATAVAEARLALGAEGADRAKVNVALAKACLALIEAGQGHGALAREAVTAADRTTGAGPAGLRVRSMVARRLAKVRLEPGPGWTNPGRLDLVVVDPPPMSAMARLANSTVRSLAARTWELPMTLILPTQAHYRINGSLVILDPGDARSEYVISTRPAEPASHGARWRVGIHGAVDPGDWETFFAGISGQYMLWSLPAVGLVTHVALNHEEPSAAAGHQWWGNLGLAVVLRSFDDDLVLEQGLSLAVDPGNETAGLGLHLAAGYRLLTHLRLGPRAQLDLFEMAMSETVAGVSLQLTFEP